MCQVFIENNLVIDPTKSLNSISDGSNFLDFFGQGNGFLVIVLCCVVILFCSCLYFIRHCPTVYYQKFEKNNEINKNKGDYERSSDDVLDLNLSDVDATNLTSVIEHQFNS